MTKIEIITNLDRVLTTEILDKFYSVSITDYSCSNENNRATLRIQADYSSDLVFKLNKLLNIDEDSKEDNAPKWIVGNSGYLHLATDINVTPSRTVKLDVTLA
jgi:hypothetical protein